MERRRVLTALGAGGALAVGAPFLAACTSGGEPSPSPGPSGGTTLAPDPLLTAARAETDLLTRAANIEARWPATGAVLGPLRAAHAAHVEALTGTPGSPTPPTGPEDGRLPGTAAAALRSLAKAERETAADHAAAARTAGPSDARLLASIAAYAAAQDVVLNRAATTTGVGR